MFVVVVVVIVLIADNIFPLDVHYVYYTMLVQRFELQRRRFTNFHYYKWGGGGGVFCAFICSGDKMDGGIFCFHLY